MVNSLEDAKILGLQTTGAKKVEQVVNAINLAGYWLLPLATGSEVLSFKPTVGRYLWQLEDEVGYSYFAHFKVKRQIEPGDVRIWFNKDELLLNIDSRYPILTGELEQNLKKLI